MIDPNQLPDFLNLPIKAVFSYLILIAFVDVAFNSILAVVRREFSAAYVLDFLRTHVLLRVFIIGALAIIGHGVAILEIPAIAEVSIAASAALGLYIIETVASLRGGLATTKPGE